MTVEFRVSLQGGQRELTSIHLVSKISSGERLGAALPAGRGLPAGRLQQLLRRGGGQAQSPRPLGAS